MVVDMPVSRFIQQIGHPGAEEPYDIKGLKAGFHEQECIDVIQRLGYACTPIEIVPTISPHPDGRDGRPIFFGLGESDNWERLLRHMADTSGVLTGIYKKLDRPTQVIGHAVAWDHVEKKIYDPNFKGQIYAFTESYNYGFVPRCFWKLQRVHNVNGHGQTQAEPAEGSTI
jgi:hypothetical protein